MARRPIAANSRFALPLSSPKIAKVETNAMKLSRMNRIFGRPPECKSLSPLCGRMRTACIRRKPSWQSSMPTGRGIPKTIHCMESLPGTWKRSLRGNAGGTAMCPDSSRNVELHISFFPLSKTDESPCNATDSRGDDESVVPVEESAKLAKGKAYRTGRTPACVSRSTCNPNYLRGDSETPCGTDEEGQRGTGDKAEEKDDDGEQSGVSQSTSRYGGLQGRHRRL